MIVNDDRFDLRRHGSFNTQMRPTLDATFDKTAKSGRRWSSEGRGMGHDRNPGDGCPALTAINERYRFGSASTMALFSSRVDRIQSSPGMSSFSLIVAVAAARGAGRTSRPLGVKA